VLAIQRFTRSSCWTCDCIAIICPLQILLPLGFLSIYTYKIRIMHLYPYLISFLVASSCITVNGQSGDVQISMLTSPDISPCTPSVQLAFQLKNTSGNSFSNVEVSFDMPPGVSFLPNSHTGVELSNDGDLSQPIFLVPNINSYGEPDFTLEVSADCELLAGQSLIQVELTYEGETFLHPIENLNIRVPTINIIDTDNYAYSGAPDDVFVRATEITSASIGEIHNLYLIGNYEENGLELIDIDNIPYSLVTLTSGEQAVLIDNSYFNSFGDSDGVFDIDDGSIVIEETLRIADCEGGASNVKVGYGCNDMLCAGATDSEVTNINVNLGTVGLDWNIVDIVYPGFCAEGEITIEVTNIGNSVAKEIILVPGINQSEYDDAPERDGCVLLEEFFINNTDLDFETSGYTGYGVELAGLTSDPDGANGLSSEDGDGVYNDLLPGEGFQFIITISSLEECLNSTSFYNRYFCMEAIYSGACSDNDQQFKYDQSFLLDDGYQDVDDNLIVEYSDGDIIHLDLYFDIDYEEGFYDACAGTGETEYFIVIPDILDFPADFELEVDNVLTPYDIMGDTIVFTGSGYNAYVEMNLEVICQVSEQPNASFCPLAGGLPRVYEFEYFANFYCDRSQCDVYKKIYNGQTSSFVVDCDEPPVSSPGVKTLDFNVERITLGWTDQSLTQKVNPQDSQIRLDRAYTHDLVKFTIPGIAEGAGVFDSSYLELSHYSGSEYTPDFYIKADTVRFYDSESDSWLTCSDIDLDSTIISGGIYLHSYNLNSLFNPGGCFDGLHLTNGDSLVFEITVQITTNAYSSFRSIPLLESGFVYQIDGNVYDCGKHEALLNIADPLFALYDDSEFSRLSCDTFLVEYNLTQGNDHSNFYDAFPAEVRPIAVFDSLVSEIPTEAEYVPGSAMIEYQYYDTTTFSNEVDTVFIPAPNVVTGTDEKFLHFINDGTYPYVDMLRRRTLNKLSFKLVPNCGMPRKYISSNVHFQSRYYAHELGLSESRVYGRGETSSYYGPERSLNLLQDDYNGSSDTARWQIELCNDNLYDEDTETISNNWIALDVGQNDILPLEVVDLFENQPPHYFAAVDTGYYWAFIDTLHGDECRILEISALLTDCDTTTIGLEVGYACHDYPLHPDSAYQQCNDALIEEQLQITPRPALLDIDLTEEPNGETPLCENINYEFIIINGQIGNASEVNVTLNINPGSIIVPGSSRVRLGNGAYTNIPDPALDTSQQGVYTWYLSDYTNSPIFDKEFPGTLDAPDNRLYLSFQLETDCDYVPESTINYSVAWRDACGGALQSSANYFGQPLPILGAPESSNTYTYEIIQDTQNACAEGIPFTINIQNEGGSTSGLTASSELIRIQLPNGTEYENGSYLPLENVPAAPNINLVMGDSLNWLEIPIQAGVDEGENLVFGISLLMNTQQFDSCALYPMQIETRQLAEIPCATAPSGNCELSFLTSRSSFAFAVEKNDLQLLNVNAEAAPYSSVEEVWSGEATITNLAAYGLNGIHQGQVFLDLNEDGVFQESIDSLIYIQNVDLDGVSPGASSDWEFELVMNAIHTCYGLHFVISKDLNCQCSTSTIYLAPPALYNAGEGQLLCGEEAISLGEGAISGYTYEWSPADYLSDPTVSMPDLINDSIVLPGAQTVLAYALATTRPGGCISEDQTEITINDIKAQLNATTDYNGYEVSCFGFADGQIVSTIEGGYAPFSYQWSTGNTQDSGVSGLEAGAYSLTVIDNEGCTDSVSIDLQSPLPLSLTLEAEDFNGFNTSCHDTEDGSIIATTGGGVFPYTYSWSNTSQNDSIITGLSADVYSLSITDQNGCESDADYSLNSPPEILITDTAIFNPTCYGGQNGSIAIVLEGGVSPYMYNNDTLSSNTLIDTALVAGSYNYTVVDQNGCLYSSAVELVELVSTFQLEADSVSCYDGDDGSLQVNSMDGYTPYFYDWDNGQNTSTASALAAGEHTVTITDFHGCEYEISGTVEQPQALDGNPDWQAVSCNGGSDGSIEAMPGGGIGPYSIFLNGSIAPVSITDLVSASYHLEVIDANGCAWDSLINVTEPAPLVDSVVTSNYNGYGISCHNQANGNIEVFVQGGTAPYSYSWQGISETTNTLEDLASGLYPFTVTDQNDCLLTDSVYLQQPDALNMSNMVTSDPTCYGGTNGSISFVLTGGAAPYYLDTLQFNSTVDIDSLEAGSFDFVFFDSNGCELEQSAQLEEQVSLFTIEADSVDCNSGSDGSIAVMPQDGYPPYTYNWSDGQTAPIATGLLQGMYEVNITDANGCIYMLSETVEEPPPLYGTIATTDIDCHGNHTGMIILEPQGGTPAYQTLLDNETVESVVDQLIAGQYQVEIIDANACTWDSLVSLTQPDLLEVSSIVEPASCHGYNDGAIEVEAIGGTSPYYYSWESGNSGNTQALLPAGTYQLSATDANNCLAEVAITVTEPPLPQPNLRTINPSCYGYFDGQLIISGAGLNDYNYSLDDEHYQISDTFLNLNAGAYLLYLQDSIGCTYSYPFDLISPPEQFIQAYQDMTIKLGDEARLRMVSELLVDSILWSAPDSLVGNTPQVIVRPYHSEGYTVAVISENGCYNEADVFITVDRTESVYVPNAFSPNGDGKNDMFTLYSGNAVLNIKYMSIFDRWGAQIFENEGFLPNIPAEGWDGTFRGEPLNNGLYTFYAEVVLIDGSTLSLEGGINLLR